MSGRETSVYWCQCDFGYGVSTVKVLFRSREVGKERKSLLPLCVSCV